MAAKKPRPKRPSLPPPPLKPWDGGREWEWTGEGWPEWTGTPWEPPERPDSDDQAPGEGE